MSDRKSGNDWRIFRCRSHRGEWIACEWIETLYGGYWSTLADFTSWRSAMTYLDRRIRYLYGNKETR
jgi:hypothetical protein